MPAGGDEALLARELVPHVALDRAGAFRPVPGAVKFILLRL
jgi:hypothetical protein